MSDTLRTLPALAAGYITEHGWTQGTEEDSLGRDILPNPVFPTAESRRRATPPRCIHCAMHVATQGHDHQCTRPQQPRKENGR